MYHLIGATDSSCRRLALDLKKIVSLTDWPAACIPIILPFTRQYVSYDTKGDTEGTEKALRDSASDIYRLGLMMDRVLSAVGRSTIARSYQESGYDPDCIDALNVMEVNENTSYSNHHHS